MRRGEYGDYDFDYGNYDFDYDYEPMNDLTACDKECGYCGNCDYQSDRRKFANALLEVDGVCQQDRFDGMWPPGHYPEQTRRREASGTKLSWSISCLNSVLICQMIAIFETI